MHPRLFEIPVIHITIYGFGLMVVFGFLAGLWLARSLARRAGLNAEIMTNSAIYALLIGVAGARIFFVIHYFDQFRGNLLDTIAVWRGGLEFLGGVIPTGIFLLVYFHCRKLPILRYLDILAVGLMLGLAFGRTGCLLNGCCYGKPTDLPWAIRFPYRSYAYISQINPDPQRDRPKPYLTLPQPEYYGFSTGDGIWYPKPLADLTEVQRHAVTEGPYRCLAVHPTQIYSSVYALALCGLLYCLWRWSAIGSHRNPAGTTLSAMLVLYGLGRFCLESVRDDNPYEFAQLTISQITGIAMLVSGLILLATLRLRSPKIHNKWPG